MANASGMDAKNNSSEETICKLPDEQHLSLYERAVCRLNCLQSNAQTIAKGRLQTPETNVQQTIDCLLMLGISLDDVDRLNVVHITGTKGKGSTAAFLETILRRCGYKTGFYSSPHMVHVRERIRIQGRPVSEQYFAEQFFHVYNTLTAALKSNQQLPAYFKFLTVLAFRIFCLEQVDVAIVEVGIGGEYDCTNVIQNPVACAITTLDLDHTKLLGNTISEIAWHKAGIAKPHSILLSVEQSAEAMDVIRQRCAERKCKFFTVPSALTEYQWHGRDGKIRLGIDGVQQHLNASLALQLARIWIQRCGANKSNSVENGGIQPKFVQPFPSLDLDELPTGDQLKGHSVPERVANALEECRWPGRSQMIRRANVVWHLDGAHTPQSIQYCAKWFKECSLDSNTLDHNIFRVLIFHCTSYRDPSTLLPKLTDSHFELALFCSTRLDCSPPVLTRENISVNMDPQTDLERCEKDRNIWQQLMMCDRNAENSLSAENASQRCSSPIPRSSVTSPIPLSSFVLSSVWDALEYVNKLADEKLKEDCSNEVHVLVTGSLHLVGGVLTFLDPECAT